MKQLTFLGLFLALAGSVPAAGQFWQQLTPAERAAAGLDHLTPEQKAALDQLAERYAKDGARHEVEVVKARAEAETVAAVRQAREEATAEVSTRVRKQKIENAGLVARDDDENIHTNIVGEFRGWTGNTTFTLANGQVWQQTDRENRFFPKMTDPEVELMPSKWAGWKIQLAKEGLWVRVKRIR